MTIYPATLRKEERICSRKLIDSLFNGSHSRAMTVFPLRLVYMPLDSGDEDADAESVSCPRAKMLISVPKRHFKRAVKRNRVKRQVREAYRKNKGIIADKAVALAFIWIDGRLHPSEEVERKVVLLLKRASERLAKETAAEGKEQP